MGRETVARKKGEQHRIETWEAIDFIVRGNLDVHRWIEVANERSIASRTHRLSRGNNSVRSLPSARRTNRMRKVTVATLSLPFDGWSRAARSCFHEVLYRKDRVDAGTVYFESSSPVPINVHREDHGGKKVNYVPSSLCLSMSAARQANGIERAEKERLVIQSIFSPRITFLSYFFPFLQSTTNENRHNQSIRRFHDNRHGSDWRLAPPLDVKINIDRSVYIDDWNFDKAPRRSTAVPIHTSLLHDQQRRMPSSRDIGSGETLAIT